MEGTMDFQKKLSEQIGDDYEDDPVPINEGITSSAHGKGISA